MKKPDIKFETSKGIVTCKFQSGDDHIDVYVATDGDWILEDFFGYEYTIMIMRSQPEWVQIDVPGNWDHEYKIIAD